MCVVHLSVDRNHDVRRYKRDNPAQSDKQEVAKYLKTARIKVNRELKKLHVGRGRPHNGGFKQNQKNHRDLECPAQRDPLRKSLLPQRL